MSSVSTKVTAVRLPNEITEKYGDRMRKLIESIYELEEKGSLVVTEDGIELPNSFNHDLPKYEECYEILKEIKSMTDFWETTLEGFLADVLILVQEGDIQRKNGFLYVKKPPFDYTKLEEACNEKGVDMQTVINKATKMLWNN